MINKGSSRVGIILLVFLIFAISGGIYIYAEIDSPMFDRFFSEATQKGREIKRLRKNFPDAIGSYVLYGEPVGRDHNKIRVVSECSKVEDHPDTKSYGIAGEVCDKGISAEYRDSLSDRVIFIHLTTVTKGKDVFTAFYDKFVKPENLNSYKVFRVENHEIGWFPLKDFDAVIIQEGRWKAGADGSVTMTYKERATGDNPVTKYFLTKFSPTISNSTSNSNSVANILPSNKSQQEDAPAANIDNDKLICSDSDNGDDYYSKGTVNFSEPLVLNEGPVVKILSSKEAVIRMGKDMKRVAAGENYSFLGPDQVYYLRSDNSNGSLMIDMPMIVFVKKINFIVAGNPNNNVSVVKKINATDQCIGNVLIENSCNRGINNGYLCVKGCSQGACVK